MPCFSDKLEAGSSESERCYRRNIEKHKKNKCPNETKLGVYNYFENDDCGIQQS